MRSYLVDYTAYMRHLAELHTALRHCSEDRHFFRGELHEFFDNLRSRVSFPALVVEGSEVAYRGERSNITKRRTTSFIVVDTYDQVGDYGEMELKVSGCEKIAEEILGRMVADKEKPFIRIEVDNGEGEYLANEAQRYVGYRITFDLIDDSCMNNEGVWDEED